MLDVLRQGHICSEVQCILCGNAKQRSTGFHPLAILDENVNEDAIHRAGYLREHLHGFEQSQSLSNFDLCPNLHKRRSTRLRVMINGSLHRRQEFSVPEQCRTEATTEQTMEMGHRSGIVKIRRPRQGEVVVGSEAGMYVCVLERFNEDCDRRKIYTEPVQKIA